MHPKSLVSANCIYYKPLHDNLHLWWALSLGHIYIKIVIAQDGQVTRANHSDSTKRWFSNKVNHSCEIYHVKVFFDNCN